jgi:hypothetical protein
LARGWAALRRCASKTLSAPPERAIKTGVFAAISRRLARRFQRSAQGVWDGSPSVEWNPGAGRLGGVSDGEFKENGEACD